VGEVPSGLPAPSLPGLAVFEEHAATILVDAVALVLIGFSQTAGDARAFAARHRYRIDVDQESVAQGMANLGAGVFQGMPVSTSLSASSLNEASGARTPMASLVSGGGILLTLVALAPLFSQLPTAILGAVIIDAVVFGMIDVAELRRLRRVARFDFVVAVAAIAGVLTWGVLAGVVIGIGLSLLWLVYVTTSPPMPLLGREPETGQFRELDEHPEGEAVPGVAVLRIDSGVFFATAEALVARVESLGEVRTLVLDCRGVNFVDSQGAETLATLQERMAERGAELRLAQVKPQVLGVLRAARYAGAIDGTLAQATGATRV
jgi:anti-anti-sigma factor